MHPFGSRSASGHSATPEETSMSTTTILIIIVVLLILFGGGWGYSRRGR